MIDTSATTWATLAAHLARHWTEITRRGSFDLSKVFADCAAAALDVHLHFVARFDAKLEADALDIDRSSLHAALAQRTAHPEISLLIASSIAPRGTLLSHDPSVSILRSGAVVQSALWTSLSHPIAVKVCYLKTAAPVLAPLDSHPWHPGRQRKLVKLSPYKGDTQSAFARRDLRI